MAFAYKLCPFIIAYKAKKDEFAVLSVLNKKRTAQPSFLMSIENRIKQSKQGIA